MHKKTLKHIYTLQIANGHCFRTSCLPIEFSVSLIDKVSWALYLAKRAFIKLLFIAESVQRVD